MDYHAFLQQKQDYGADSGFDTLYTPEFLFDFQKALTDWAIRKGRAAIFADCGMGKTLMQLVWAENVVRKTGKPVLILTPLAVSGQTLDEAEKFGIEAKRATVGKNPLCIQVTNYERLHHFDCSNYGGVVCDESSILKNFDGTYKAAITEFMRSVPYRLLCTATAAPNDWIELGTSSEALGYLGYTDMLSKFFTNKNNTVALRRMRFQKDEFRLRAYAEKDFWRWVASWSRAARKPADLGFDNDGFVLPPMIENDVTVEASQLAQGMLFELPALDFHQERDAVRRSLVDRCEKAAELALNHGVSVVWCNLNDESKLLHQLIPGSVEIVGSDSEDKKEDAARWFCNGSDKQRILISKASIFGLGLNFQHCAHATYFPTHSYESYYQAVRRLWRYGQTRQVVIDRIYTKGTERMLENLVRKAKAADKMFDELIKYMYEGVKVENIYNSKTVEVPLWLSK